MSEQKVSDLYKYSIEKYEDIEHYKTFEQIFDECVFCYEAKHKSLVSNDIRPTCDYCLCDKEICSNRSNEGFLSELNDYRTMDDDEILYIISLILDRLKENYEHHLKLESE